MTSDGDVVAPGTALTQTGHVEDRSNARWARLRFSFRAAMRAERDELYVSLIAGRLTVPEAVPLVSRHDRAGDADAVRYAQAGTLQEAGFTVVYRPSRTIPDHVGVTWDRNGDWDDIVAAKFTRCFVEYVPGVAE